MERKRRGSEDQRHLQSRPGEPRRLRIRHRHVSARGCLIEFLNAVTGWDATLEELLATGERIANLRQAFNIREGLNPLEYVVSGRLEGKPPLTAGPLAGVTIDQDAVNREFLEAMDWDLKTTKPSKKSSWNLGLDEVARPLAGGKSPVRDSRASTARLV